MQVEQLLEELKALIPLNRNRKVFGVTLKEYYEVSKEQMQAIISLLSQQVVEDKAEQLRIDEWEDMHGM